ncbi:MAG: site-specific integrase, partial [Actinobacteria bacterium]|nr:site-specific integrase [Actinomycetota bacterium]
MTRRGFGTVRKLPSGRWQARYRLPDGSRLSAGTSFSTKRDASRWLATVEADQARGLWVDPRAGRMILGQFAASWLASKVGISPRTREIYDLQLRLHVLPRLNDEIPALGSVPIGDITPELVRAWYVALDAERGASV